MVPPHKQAYKRYIRASITQYWTVKLSNTATNKPSLYLLRTPSLTLGNCPHPIWTTCSHPYQARVATIQTKMLLSTYRSCYHTRHWQGYSGAYQLPNCGSFPGDLHMFKSCPFLAPAVKQYSVKAKDSLLSYPYLRTLFSRKLAQSPVPSH